jgi:hypothetical protein
VLRPILPVLPSVPLKAHDIIVVTSGSAGQSRRCGQLAHCCKGRGGRSCNPAICSREQKIQMRERGQVLLSSTNPSSIFSRHSFHLFQFQETAHCLRVEPYLLLELITMFRMAEPRHQVRAP